MLLEENVMNQMSDDEREIQRTMLQLLNQLHGFDSRRDIKAIYTKSDLMAVEERPMKATNENFRKSKERVFYRKNQGRPQ
ncbi:unnamed protein product [Rotaria sp. Silwood2]|nr:unnamed protein product [Rotaria sp. Silwood2]CAF2990819.1 unnamed protein product [Rotaria sp. Silwood2]CAF3379473.1 unnamed protein product [Rotaria sp. Silwood2]CAF4256615.1 unnamed protein product [Rotaria sp. Silwood2]CAF4418993.1 unnamed protein product [Rotaria sp. Silwood2]